MTLGRPGALVLAVATAAALAACGSSPPTPTPVEGGVGATGAPLPANLAALRGPWSATPLAVDPALRASIDRACRASMGTGPDGFPAGVQLVLIDARGGGVVQAFYAGGGSEANCNDMTINPDGTVEALGGGGWGSGGPGAVVAGLRIAGSGNHGAPVAASYVWGRSGPEIVRVVVEQVGRPPIVATKQGAFWAASIEGDWVAGWKVAGYNALGVKVSEVSGQ